MLDSPSLPAIRERLERAEQAKAAWNAGAADEQERIDHYGPEDGDWQAFLTRALAADRAVGSAWAALLHHAPADLAFLLALVARLQGERNSLRAAVDDYHGWITKARDLDPDSQECRDAWIEAQCAEGRLFAARAALGEE